MRIVSSRDPAPPQNGRTHRWIQVNKDGSRHVFPGTGLSEEGLERSVSHILNLFGVGATILLESVLQQIPEIATSQYRGRVGQEPGRRTAPKRCFLAGYRPGRYECGRPVV